MNKRFLKLILLSFAVLNLYSSTNAQIITTIAGTSSSSGGGDGGPATLASVPNPKNVFVDVIGNIYISTANTIRKINTSGIITTVGGGGLSGSVEGGPATDASLHSLEGLWVDNSGNIYFTESSTAQRVRKINASGIMTTYAGNGIGGYSGDNGPATAASFKYPTGLVMDPAGNLYIGDVGNFVIRKVTPTGIISTIAGTAGTPGFSGDGGPATAATLGDPQNLAINAAGELFIADVSYHKIRKINTSGIISTIAGNGIGGYSGDGGLATQAQINQPRGLKTDASGNVYFADGQNHRIRKITNAGIMLPVAGRGIPSYGGDGGQATAALFCYPSDVAMDLAGNLLVADNSNNRIRKIDFASLAIADPRTSDIPDIYAYPNPSNGCLNLKIKAIWSGNAEIIITNFSGQKVKILTVPLNTENRIDLSQQIPGVYIITAILDNVILQQAVIVSN